MLFGSGAEGVEHGIRLRRVGGVGVIRRTAHRAGLAGAQAGAETASGVPDGGLGVREEIAGGDPGILGEGKLALLDVGQHAGLVADEILEPRGFVGLVVDLGTQCLGSAEMGAGIGEEVEGRIELLALPGKACGIEGLKGHPQSGVLVREPGERFANGRHRGAEDLELSGQPLQGLG